MKTEVINADVFDNSDNVVSGVQFFITLSNDEVDTMLAAYDSASGTTPSVSITRPVTRAMLNAIIALRG